MHATSSSDSQNELMLHHLFFGVEDLTFFELETRRGVMIGRGREKDASKKEARGLYIIVVFRNLANTAAPKPT